MIKNILFENKGDEGLYDLRQVTGMSDLESRQLGDQDVIMDRIQPVSQASNKIQFLRSMIDAINLVAYPDREKQENHKE